MTGFYCRPLGDPQSFLDIYGSIIVIIMCCLIPVRDHDIGFQTPDLGSDFYLPFFKLIPELKFSFSPLNTLQKNRDDLLDANYLKYTASVDKAMSKMITLSLYFE